MGSFRIIGASRRAGTVPVRRLGSFRIIGSWAEFLDSRLRGNDSLGGNWVRFAEIGGGWTLGMRELGSFCIFWVGGIVGVGQIGFVLQKSGVAGHLVYENWVRFAFFAWDRVAVGVNWVRFAEFASTGRGGCGF